MVFPLRLSHQGVKALQQQDPFSVVCIALIFICFLLPGLSLSCRNAASCLFTCPISRYISQPFNASLHREQVSKPRHRPTCAPAALCPYCVLCPGASHGALFHHTLIQLLMRRWHSSWFASHRLALASPL